MGLRATGQSLGGLQCVVRGVVSPALSDEALLFGLAAGDADAATAFIRRFQARVYGLVLTIVRDERMAEDVAQATFVRAWKHARTFDPRRGRVATWLLAIARNLAIDVPAEELPGRLLNAAAELHANAQSYEDIARER